MTNPMSEPMSEPVSEPVSEPMSEPVSQPTSDPTAQPAGSPDVPSPETAPLITAASVISAAPVTEGAPRTAAATGPAAPGPVATAGGPRTRLFADRLFTARIPESNLFDPPGPRGRRRIAIATVAAIAAIIVVIWLALRQFAANGQLEWSKWQLFTQWPIIHYLLTALGATVEVTLVAGAIALPFGALLALGRLARSRVVRWPATVYVEVMRAVPLLLLIYAFLLGLPETGFRLPLFWQLVWPIVLTNAAVLAEIFRAGTRAVERGQSEAAFSLGLGYWATMRMIVLPQAVRRVTPSLVSQLIRLLKDSTLGYVVSYLELLNAAKVLGEYNQTVLQAFLVVAAVYVVINTLLASAAGRLERRLGPRRVRTSAKPA